MPRKAKRRRDTPAIANRHYIRDPVDDVRLPSLFTAIRSPLLEVEDRRTWSPEPILDDPPRTPRRPAQIREQKRAVQRRLARSQSPYVVNQRTALVQAFKTPKVVAVCVRRKQRREVLLAMGKGGGGKRRPRRNNLSNVRC